MGTHPIFESDFDCLTDTSIKYKMSGQVSQEQMLAMQNEQMKDFLKSYNKTTQLCFNDCVQSFTTADLSSTEIACGQKCVEKYLEYSARVAQQFIKRNSPQ